MDLVHVRYDRCPAAQRPRLHTGKGDFPTMGYRQFHTGHNRYIFQYKMNTGNVSTFFVACGDLCDGGYHKWLHAICGAKDADNLDMHAWSAAEVDPIFDAKRKRLVIHYVSELRAGNIRKLTPIYETA
eukprot:jgi/Tetstr1/441888/TSEL_030098.t1